MIIPLVEVVTLQFVKYFQNYLKSENIGKATIKQLHIYWASDICYLLIADN